MYVRIAGNGLVLKHGSIAYIHARLVLGKKSSSKTTAMVVKERLDVQPLALPAELRHTIYEMALGPDTYPHARWVDYTEAEGLLVLGSHHMMQSSIIAKTLQTITSS